MWVSECVNTEGKCYVISSAFVSGFIDGES